MLKQLDRTMRGRVSSHKSTSARSCTTRAVRGRADLSVKTLQDKAFQDNAQYQDGPQQACNKSLSAFLTLHRKLVGQVQM